MLCAHAAECVASDDTTVWKHSNGLFHRYQATPGGNGKAIWKEYDADRNLLAQYEEKERQNGAVILRDNSRGGLEVLLRRDISALKQPKEREFQQMYAGTFLRVAHCE